MLLFTDYLLTSPWPMEMSVEETFKEFSCKFPQLDLKLASGGLSDVNGLSDVDISLCTLNYDQLDHVFIGATKYIDDHKPRVIYSFQFHGREVNVYATNDCKLAERALIHRRNELALNHFDLLVAQAIILKQSNMGTEPAWARVLQLDGDPYEAMLMDFSAIVEIAKSRNEQLKMNMSKLNIN